MRHKTAQRVFFLLIPFLLISGLLPAFPAFAQDTAPEPRTYTLSIPIQSAADDLEEWTASGEADAGSNDLEIGCESPGSEDIKPQIVGLRFAEVPVLPGATITQAYVQFTVFTVKYPADPLDIAITAGDTANAAPFYEGETAPRNALSSLQKTALSVRWASGGENRYSWDKEGKSGKAQRTPDLSALVQAVVDRDGWAYGNAIALFFTGSGNRTAYAWEKSRDKAAVLYLTFTVESAAQPAPDGVLGAAPTTLFEVDGSITGTTAQMEYRPAGDETQPWKPCAQGAITGLASGNYEVRYAARPCYTAGEILPVRVPLYAGDLTLQPGADETEMNVTWFFNGSHAETCYAQVAPASAMAGDAFPEAEAEQFSGEAKWISAGYRSNKLTVTGLAANTGYVYRVGNGENWSDTFRFATRDSASYSVLFVADPQIGASGATVSDTKGWQETLARALTTFPEVSFMLSAGDHVQSLSDETEYEKFFSPLALRSLPLASAVGNHDDGGNCAAHYFTPNESTLGGTISGYDYWFTYGNTLYMVLNTNNRDTAEHGAFLRQAVAAAGGGIRWKIVLFHHSIYCSASHSLENSTLALRDKLYPLMDECGVDVVLMGHDHCYTRTYQMLGNVAQNGLESTAVNPPGTLYVTGSSASGSMYYVLKDADSAYRAVRWPENAALYSCFTVSDSAFSIATYETSTNLLIDQYTIIKDSAAPASLTGVAPTAADAADGRIDGTTAAMEYRRTRDSEWTACGEGTTGGLPPGTYAVRYRAADAQAASAETTVNVPGYFQAADGAQ